MANRFPLILNTSSNQIQELSSSDTLDLTGSGLNLTGITTLSTSAQLNLGGGTNINTGTRGDILFYNASGTIQKLSLGATGKILKSNGTDLVYGDSGTTANVYYVSTGGTDASGFGGSLDRAFKTVKYAVANIGTPSATAPAIIFVKSGVYEEVQLPIVVPAHTTIAGDSLRATIIKPGAGNDSGGSVLNTRSILFRMSNATVLQDLVMDGMGGYTPGSPAYKPESATIGGTYLALNAASPILTKSPYIYNVTSFGNGATGAVLDGSVHGSGNRSMLFHTYTAVHSDGLGIFLKANANAEMISTFTYYCQIGFAAIGGSKIRSLNSSNAYGEYGVYSAGFDAGESPNQGTVRGNMLTYVGVLGTSFQDGERIVGGSSGASAYVVNVQSEPKRMYVVQKSGTFSANETVTGQTSNATATMAAASVETNQSGRILVTQFSSSADAGDSLQFATTDGNAYQIQSVSSVTANSVAYHVLVFSTSRPTPVATGVTVNVRKEFSLIRLTGHDFLQVGTGGTDTTNWPNNPTQNPNQAYQVTTNSTDPGRVYYTATDDLGNFYVGDQFKVDQATGNVTLDASAFNLSGLESLRLGSVGGLIGASINEFSTDGTLSQNSDTKVSTQKAVKTYVDTLDDITPTGGTFTIAGISTVTGTTHFTKQLNVSGVTTFHGNVNFLDGDRLRIGSSQDFQLYHDTNNSYIAENGTGNLLIQATTGSIILQRDNGHEMIKANIGGSVELYHNDGKKIETTATGAVITGIITAHDFLPDTNAFRNIGTSSKKFNFIHANTFVGNGDFVELDVDGHTNLDNVSIAGVVTATTFGGSGASLTNLNGSNIASGTVPVARIGTGTKNTTTFYRGDGTFQVVNTDLVSDTSPQLGGDLDCNNKVVSLNDSTGAGNNRLKIGNAGDLQLFHLSDANYVSGEVDGKDLYVRSRRDLHLVCGNNSGGYRNVIYADNNGTARLYHPASSAVRLQTSTTGVTVTGSVTASSYGSLGNYSGLFGKIRIGADVYGNTIKTAGDNNFNITANTSIAFNLGAASNGSDAGSSVAVVVSTGFRPTTNGQKDLGESSYRWRNVYTSDLDLSNEGSKNDVDGTWGSYTIQEGESDLFLINKRSGKKYKFNLTEVN